MANFLAQFLSIKNSCERVVIAVEDVSDLWPHVKKGFEERLPIRRAALNNKTRNPVSVENLPAEFILTTDTRLRSRFPQEQFLFSFREPYATVILVACEDLDEFKTILKPRLKLILQNDEREWFIVYVSRALPQNDQATKMAKKVYARIEVDFSSKKRERCCKLDIHAPEATFWDDLESKITECIKNTLDRRIQFYEEEIRKLSEQRFKPVWSFCNFFILKESLAFMFEIAHLHEDSLREYDELELCYLETVNMAGKLRDFGGMENGDDQAALLTPGKKPLTQIVQDDSFREFEFRQYLFACQAKLLFKLNRPFEVASRGFSFVISFSKALALHEVWHSYQCPFSMLFGNSVGLS
ncbi:CLUB [Artemisia annua]|uniref:CLUB n=1 Tax=Artemisia annua TaxID=35608 RepID=A0A2U1LH76_ARTAN|nr:CLUB [Artemisia annua]